MKYLEEISPGDTFINDNHHYVLTVDFKKNGDRLCYSLSNGHPKWFSANAIVEVSPTLYQDKDGNLLPLKTK